MVHFAKDYNEKNGYEKGSSLHIQIFLDGIREALTDKSDDELITIMTENTFVRKDNNEEDPNQVQKYTTEIEYDEYGRVNKVTCRKV